MTRLRTMVVAITAMLAALALAACGGGTVGGGNTGPTEVAKGGKATGDITISNWPGYIDPGANGTVNQFQNDTGVKVNDFVCQGVLIRPDVVLVRGRRLGGRAVHPANPGEALPAAAPALHRAGAVAHRAPPADRPWHQGRHRRPRRRQTHR